VIISTRGLTRRFGDLVAIDNLDLDLPAGGVVGLVGPNGSGKSTLIRMLLGLIAPSAGSAQVLGAPIRDPRAYAHRVGALIDSPAFVPGLSARSNLVSLARLRGLPISRVEEVLDTVGLAGRDREPVKRFSLGMKQRLGIAAALLSDPELLILDEPTNGLDPQGIVDMRALIRSIADDGPTVLVSSHLLTELQQICDWLLMIEAGRQVYQGRTADLLAGGARLRLRSEHSDDLDRLGGLLRAHGYEPAVDGAGLVLPADAVDDAELARLNKAAAGEGITLVEMARTAASLEERYGSLVVGGVR
jgi:ABC-2 type transport system ATP-binding protein